MHKQAHVLASWRLLIEHESKESKNMEITLIPQRQEHWTWKEENARECAHEERELRSLAENPVVLALASALGIGAREAAVMAQKRARARANTRAA